MLTNGQSWAMFLVRVCVGGVFAAHGLAKFISGEGIAGVANAFENLNIPVPYASALAAALTELIGGLLLVVGAFTRLAAIPLAFTMAVAGATAHPNAFFLKDGGMEYVLVLGVCSVALFLGGPGPFAIDHALKRRKKK